LILAAGAKRAIEFSIRRGMRILDRYEVLGPFRAFGGDYYPPPYNRVSS
jgi:hypothetical protein